MATTQTIVRADATEFLRAQEEGSLDLVFGSPPYEEARLYLEGGVNLGVSRKTDAWVAWLVEWWGAAQRACKGLVVLVVAGQTKNYRWSAGPALLTAELHRAGFNLRNPPLYHRVGIPGSGGPDWLRADYEWVICTSRPGRLPWSDNTACGHIPKWAPGGEMSHRRTNGARVNQWGMSIRPDGSLTSTSRGGDGGGNLDERKRRTRKPSHRIAKGFATSGHKDGDTLNDQGYDPPDLANPGNVISLNVGGCQMGGDTFASQNEAPFPEKLAEFFVLSFAPPGGLVCDTFSGSGTVAAVCKRHGRNFTGCDLRQSQVDLTLRRLESETPMMFT